MAEGRPVPNTDQLVAMAESLLPRLKAAEWRDRAEAADKDVDEISLRDLRSVVAGADMARDEETRALAARLREALDRRVEGLRFEWSEEIARHLDDHKVVRALRLAARPPEPAARLDAALAERLSDAAGRGPGARRPGRAVARPAGGRGRLAGAPISAARRPAGRRDPRAAPRRPSAVRTNPGPGRHARHFMPPPPSAETTRKASSRRRSRAGDAKGRRPGEGAGPGQESPPDQRSRRRPPPASRGQRGHRGRRARATDTPTAGAGQAGNRPTTPRRAQRRQHRQTAQPPPTVRTVRPP